MGSCTSNEPALNNDLERIRRLNGSSEAKLNEAIRNSTLLRIPIYCPELEDLGGERFELEARSLSTVANLSSSIASHTGLDPRCSRYATAAVLLHRAFELLATAAVLQCTAR